MDMIKRKITAGKRPPELSSDPGDEGLTFGTGTKEYSVLAILELQLSLCVFDPNKPGPILLQLYLSGYAACPHIPVHMT